MTVLGTVTKTGPFTVSLTIDTIARTRQTARLLGYVAAAALTEIDLGEGPLGDSFSVFVQDVDGCVLVSIEVEVGDDMPAAALALQYAARVAAGREPEWET